MGPVYHVLVTKEFPGKTTSIEFNKSKEALKNDIVFPYNAFKDFQCEGRYFHPGYITQILIYKTDKEIKDIMTADPNNQIKAEKNSEKWNKVVLEYGQQIKEAEEGLELNTYDPSFIEDFIFSKHRSLTNSIETMNDFSKVMITLIAGLFTAYFALIKFLEIKVSSIAPIPYVPPALFIASIAFLIVGAKPYIFLGEVKKKKWSFPPLNRTELNTEEEQMADLKSRIERFRKYTFHTKYLPMLIGMIIFLVGLIFTLYIMLDQYS